MTKLTKHLNVRDQIDIIEKLLIKLKYNANDIKKKVLFIFYYFFF